MVFPSFFEGFIVSFGLILLSTTYFIDPLFSYLRENVLPKPGQGPSVEA